MTSLCDIGQQTSSRTSRLCSSKTLLPTSQNNCITTNRRFNKRQQSWTVTFARHSSRQRHCLKALVGLLRHRTLFTAQLWQHVCLPFPHTDNQSAHCVKLVSTHVLTVCSTGELALQGQQVVSQLGQQCYTSRALLRYLLQRCRSAVRQKLTKLAASLPCLRCQVQHQPPSDGISST